MEAVESRSFVGAVGRGSNTDAQPPYRQPARLRRETGRLRRGRRAGYRWVLPALSLGNLPLQPTIIDLPQSYARRSNLIRTRMSRNPRVT